MVNSHLPLSWDIVSWSCKFNNHNTITIIELFTTYIGGICFKWAQFRHTRLGVDGDHYWIQCLVPVISTWLILLLWLHNQTGRSIQAPQKLGCILTLLFIFTQTWSPVAQPSCHWSSLKSDVLFWQQLQTLYLKAQYYYSYTWKFNINAGVAYSPTYKIFETFLEQLALLTHHEIWPLLDDADTD